MILISENFYIPSENSFLDEQGSDPAYVSKVTRRLSSITQFDYELAALPSGKVILASSSCPRYFGDKGGRIDAICAQSTTAAGVYCCQGVNFLHIDTEGYCYGAKCPMSVAPLPLWHKNAEINVERVFHCANQICPGGVNSIIPKFASFEEAEQYLKDRKNALAQLELTSVRQERAFIRQPDARRRLVARYNRLEPVTALNKLGGRKQEGLFALNVSVVAKISEALADDSSREMLLRCVKAIDMGNAGYLPAEKNSDSRAGLEKDRRLVGLDDVAGAREMAYQLHLSLARVVISIPLWSADMLNLLSWLVSTFPGRHFRAHQGAGNLYITPVCQEASAPRVGVSGGGSVTSPWLSVIVIADDAEDRHDGLARTLDSALMQAGANVEILVVKNISNDTVENIVQSRGDFSGGCIRRLNCADLEPGALLQQAVSNAQGKYLLFLRSGDVMAPCFLEKAESLLAGKEPEIVAFASIVAPATENDAIMVGEAAAGLYSMTAFLAAWLRGYSLGSCLLKREFVLNACIHFGRLDIDYELLLGSAAFLNATKVSFETSPGVVRLADSIMDYERNPSAVAGSMLFLEAVATGVQAANAIVAQGVARLFEQGLQPILINMRLDKMKAASGPAAVRHHKELMATDRYLETLLIRAAKNYCRRHPEAYKEKLDEQASIFNRQPEFLRIPAEPAPAGQPWLAILVYSHNDGRVLTN